MKKVQTIVIATLLLFLAATPGTAMEKVTFAVGEWAPFLSQSLKENGPVCRIITAACKEAGYEAEFQFMKWNRAINLVMKGKMAGTFPWSHTEEREQKGCLFPETPIFQNVEVVWFKKDKFPNGLEVKNFSDLKPYSMVGLLGYWYEKEANSAGIALHTVPDEIAALKMIESGRKDVWIENQFVAQAKIKEVLGDKASALGHSGPLKSTPLYLVLSKNHPQGPVLQTKLNAVFKTFSENGTIARMLNE
ncbi:MAG: transporter substrate-binding domain-containing protein [Desulfobacterales bacterium]|nr:transporter substrate-binding domain-containing protein [Desulfobacterales bacterium]